MHALPPHPSLVKLIGFSVVPPLALVLELATGGALYDMLHSTGLFQPNDCRYTPIGRAHSVLLVDPKYADDKLTWRRRVLLARDIVRGVLHMHRNRVLHRDIKVLNCALTMPCSSNRVRP
jgi:serine/threonine protein kinase